MTVGGADIMAEIAKKVFDESARLQNYDVDVSVGEDEASEMVTMNLGRDARSVALSISIDGHGPFEVLTFIDGTDLNTIRVRNLEWEDIDIDAVNPDEIDRVKEFAEATITKCIESFDELESIKKVVLGPALPHAKSQYVGDRFSRSMAGVTILEKMRG
jgi:hypothetical protein